MKSLVSILAAISLFVGSFCAVLAEAAQVTYNYDDAGRLVGVDYGDGQRIIYQYDKMGNMLRKETTPRTTLSPGVKVNFLNGPFNLVAGTPISVIAGMQPGNQAGRSATWWIGVYAGTFEPPYNWFTLSEESGWQLGLMPYKSGPVERMPWTEVLNLPLPTGTFYFFFAVDIGSDWTLEGVDIVEVEGQ